jgi:hypothetical protein
MVVVLKLNPEAARLLIEELASSGAQERVRSLASSAASRSARHPAVDPALASIQRVLSLVQKVHATVVPLDQSTTDSALSTFFTIHVPDTQDATRLAAVLVDVSLVEAAYVKPSDEPPVV